MSSPENETKTTCARCGKEIVEGQRVEHRGSIYCADCVGKSLNGHAPVRQQGRHSVAGATLLSLFLPGVGQMYNGQLIKGVLVIAGFLLVCIGEGPFEVLGHGGLKPAAIVAIYFWQLFDAYWTARRINQSGLPIVPPTSQDEVRAWSGITLQIGGPAQAAASSASAAWGVLLIVLGILFLLNNFGLRWLTWDRLWPAALLALGLWMLISFVLSRRPSAPPEAPSEEMGNG